MFIQHLLKTTVESLRGCDECCDDALKNFVDTPTDLTLINQLGDYTTQTKNRIRDYRNKSWIYSIRLAHTNTARLQRCITNLKRSK